MLLAARNLTLLADVLPTICSSIVRHGAVPALCARLMTIEYIDLAEQSLQVSVHAVPQQYRCMFFLGHLFSKRALEADLHAFEQVANGNYRSFNVNPISS